MSATKIYETLCFQRLLADTTTESAVISKINALHCLKTIVSFCDDSIVHIQYNSLEDSSFRNQFDVNLSLENEQKQVRSGQII